MPDAVSDVAVSFRSFQEKSSVFRVRETFTAEDVTFQYQLHTSGSRSELIVEIGVSMRIKQLDEPIIELTTTSTFALKETLEREQVEQKLSANVMFSLIGVAYASTRGMLAEKTGGAVVMPLQNIAELFHEEFQSISLPVIVY